MKEKFEGEIKTYPDKQKLEVCHQQTCPTIDVKSSPSGWNERTLEGNFIKMKGSVYQR